jgi:hypothetical protein
MSASSEVFISYSHDSPEHAERVLALADALRENGIVATLDQYVHPAPEEGWPRWMDTHIEHADFVLMVCTANYRRRVMGQAPPGEGLGVRWEGSLIYSRIYNDKPSGARFIPVLLKGSQRDHIPNPVQGHTFYCISDFTLSDSGFELLIRHLTKQSPNPPPDIGPIPALGPRPRRPHSENPRQPPR